MTPPSELALERGEEEPAGERKPRGESERSRRRHRADIKERLYAIFARLADSLEGRGDAELAGMIREDSRAMVEGLASLVKRAPGFAAPIMALLSVLEPLIAFGRILRLLGRRLGERRARRFEEGGELEEPGEGPCADGIEGCEILVPHRHEAEGIVYF